MVLGCEERERCAQVGGQVVYWAGGLALGGWWVGGLVVWWSVRGVWHAIFFSIQVCNKLQQRRHPIFKGR